MCSLKKSFLFRITDCKVRLFKELNTLRLKRKLGSTTICFSKLITHLSWPCFAARTNFVMRRPNIVCNKRMQWGINLFRRVELILCVIACSCRILNLSTWNTNHCWVLFNLSFVSYHQLTIFSVGIDACFLKSHCVIRRFVFLVNA